MIENISNFLKNLPFSYSSNILVNKILLHSYAASNLIGYSTILLLNLAYFSSYIAIHIGFWKCFYHIDCSLALFVTSFLE